ncbi:MAG: cation:proton antiporter [Puniceicoccaceae bacterium]
MNGLAALLFVAAVAFGLARWTRIPEIPLLVAAGFALRLAADASGLELPTGTLFSAVELGLAMLVFSAGIDLSPRRLRGRTGPILSVGLWQFSILGLVGVGLALALGYAPRTALYLGCALSASSTLVVVRILQRRQLMFEPFGRLVLGVLLLQDVLIVVLLVVLENLDAGAADLLLACGRAALLGAFALALHRFVVPFAARRLHLDDEERLLFALGILFLFIYLAVWLGLPFVVGGFLAGFALSAFPMNGLIRGMLGSLSSFFLALFFIGIGFFCILPPPLLWLHALLFALVLVLVTVVLVSWLAERHGLSARDALEAGVLLSQTSEFSLLVLLAGVGAGLIGEEVFSMFVLLTVATMALTPFLARERVVRRLMKLHPRARRGTGEPLDVSGHAVLIGYDQTGPTMERLLRQAGVPVVVVDEDPAVIRRLAEEGVRFVEGNAASPEVLGRANLRGARLVLAGLTRRRGLRELLEQTRLTDTLVLIRAFEPEERLLAGRYEGVVVVDTVEATVRAFERWMEKGL